MPSSADSALIGFGLIFFVLGLFNGAVKYGNIELPKLDKTNNLILMSFGLFLLLLGIFFHGYALTHTDIPELKKENKIRLNEKNVKFLFKSKGFEELSQFPVTKEIITAFHDGFSSYQTRICNSKNNQMIVVPLNFTRCPESDKYETPHLGPALDLSQFE